MLTGEWSFHSSKNDRIILVIEDKKGKHYNLYFSDPRNLGILSITNNKKKLDDELIHLAPDYLKNNLEK